MDNIKKLNEMRRQVKEELDHIPRRNFNQNMLRQVYWSLRLHSIGKKAETECSKEDILVKATELIQKDNPDFCPTGIDYEFFNRDNACKAAKGKTNVLACFQKKEI